MLAFLRNADPRTIASFLFTFALSLIVLAIVSGGVAFWSVGGPTLVPSGTYLLLGAIGCIALSWAVGGFQLSFLVPSPLGAAGALTLLFLTDWLCRGYSFFQGPSIRGELLLFSIIAALLPFKRLAQLLQGYAVFACILLVTSLLGYLGSRTLISDDHASFLFRLQALRENFPHIPFYAPSWNGGMDARDFFATGALNIFFLSLPLTAFWPVESVYNIIVALILFLLVPLSSFVAARLSKIPYPGPAIAALLSVSVSLVWYKWALKYGTMGFVTTAALIPLNLALAARILSKEESISRFEAILTVVLITLMLFWSLSAIVFIPCAVLALLQLKRLLGERRIRRIAISLFVLNVPWIILFLSVSNVIGFVHKGTVPSQSSPTSAAAPSSPTFKSKEGKLSLAASLKAIRETAISTNPLLLLFTLPGLLLLDRRRRGVWVITLSWLLILGAAISPLKPQLELDRMLILLGLLSSIPASAAIGSLLTTSKDTLPSRILIAITGGFLFVGPLCAAAITKNRSIEQFSVSTSLTHNLTRAIREQGGQGRVLFSGFILHELDGGHVAPLTYATGKPLMASSQFHNLWRYRQIFPQSFIARKLTGGIEEYLDLYNVSSVISHEREWREYFASRPDRYRLVWREGRFSLFTRIGFNSSYVLEGQAAVVPRERSVEVIPHTREVILKFNYFPFLRAQGCTIESAQVAPEVHFVRLIDCPLGERTEVKSAGPWARVTQ